MWHTSFRLAVGPVALVVVGPQGAGMPKPPPTKPKTTKRKPAPWHWQAVADLLDAHMTVRGHTAGTLVALLGRDAPKQVKPGTLYAVLRGERALPLTWVDMGEVSEGNNHSGQRMDLTRALGLSKRDADAFKEAVLISQGPVELADLVKRLRKGG